MTFRYEELGPDRFQELCQALMLFEHPNFHVFPVRQRDGGRDGLAHISGARGRGFVVFQVKLQLSPTDAHKWLKETLSDELENIQRLESLGAKKYVLLTNIHSTAVPGSGLIDLARDFFTKHTGMDAQVLWREDLDRRIDARPALKWSYPALLSGPDFLRLLAGEAQSTKLQAAWPKLRAFVATQKAKESELRFKQLGLSSDLMGLFVDVPLVLKDCDYRVEYTAELEAEDVARRRTKGAAEFFLRLRTNQRHRKHFVVEGAPGQGKSTVTQYIAQILRRRFLLESVTSSSDDSSVWFPVRLDVRDLSSWLQGISPFGEGASISSRTLEAFVAALISAEAGQTVSIEDLSLVMANVPVYLFMDGLDEVADVDLRRRVCEQVSLAAARMSANALDLRLLITTRPAVFARNMLSEREFQYTFLDDVPPDVIRIYAEKWARAKSLPAADARALVQLIQRKMKEPHVAALARNTMQLSILLHLLQARGEALPEKRSALYASYVSVFMDRESEKSDLVRANRDLLLSLHGFLAWHLHAVAERDGLSGRLSDSELTDLLRAEVARMGHDVELVDDLAIGVRERVLFLSSRIQGYYEFDVQTLREYFAAIHLFESAPASPLGAESKGTRQERFDELLRRPHWLNVARFFAGSSPHGELSTLYESVVSMMDDPSLGTTSRPYRVAQFLLSDWVFAQKPKLSDMLVARIWRPEVIALLSASEYVRRSTPEVFTIPPSYPPRQLISILCDCASSVEHIDSGMLVSQLSSLFGLVSAAELERALINASLAQRRYVIEAASRAGVLKKFSADVLEKAFATDEPSPGELSLLVRGGWHDFVLPRWRELFVRKALSGELGWWRGSGRVTPEMVIAEAISIFSSVEHWIDPRHETLSQHPRFRNLVRTNAVWSESPDSLHKAADGILDVVSRHAGTWRDGALFSDVVQCLLLAGDGRGVQCVAIIGGLLAIAPSEHMIGPVHSYFELVQRRNDAQFLVSSLNAAAGPERWGRVAMSAMAVSGRTLEEVAPHLEQHLSDMADREYGQLLEFVHGVSPFVRPLMITKRLRATSFSDRLAGLLLARVSVERRPEASVIWTGGGKRARLTPMAGFVRLIGLEYTGVVEPREAVRLAALARKSGLSVNRFRHVRIAAGAIDSALAGKVLRDPKSYVPGVVAQSDVFLQKSADLDCPPLLDVAEENEWFEVG